MPHFADFQNISERFDALIRDEAYKEDMRIPVSNNHNIFMSITRIGLFKTGGIHVELVSISKFGALFSSNHHSLLKCVGKDMTVELSLDGKYFQYEAHIVQQDSINDLYGIKFNQQIESVDNYLKENHINLHSDDTLRMGSVWLQLARI